jgi:hypothetical protein
MVNCQPAFLSFETPPSLRNRRLLARPFDDVPSKPRVGNRVSVETANRVLTNLEILSAPSLIDGASPLKKNSSVLRPNSPPISPLFDVALRRMGVQRDLLRFKAERDDFLLEGSESRISAPPPKADSKKQMISSSTVTLAKKIPRRNSGVALSA